MGPPNREHHVAVPPCTGVCRSFDTRTSAVGFSSELPTRLNRTLDLLANNRVRFKVDAFDEVHLMQGLQEIANRITLGLVMAALIVSAAMLMRREGHERARDGRGSR